MATVEQITAKASADKVLIGLVSAVFAVMGGVYGSAKLALSQANKKANAAMERSDSNVVAFNQYIREQRAFNIVLMDSIEKSAKQTRILTSEVKQIKTEIFVVKEATKVYPPIYSQINYIATIVKEQSDFLQKKK